MEATSSCATWSLGMSKEPTDRSTISIHTGFPNAAEDSRLHTLDLNTLLIQNPISTFFFSITGSDWEHLGIFDRDIALIDKALHPHPNDHVIWIYEDSFAISRQREVSEGGEIWGVVTAVIHLLRKRHVRAH